MHFDEEMRVKLHNLISETQVIIKVKTMLIADFMVRCMGERYSKELQKLFWQILDFKIALLYTFEPGKQAVSSEQLA